MTQIRATILMLLLAVSGVAMGQEPAKAPDKPKSEDRAALEKELWKVDQEWLCSAGATPYHKNYQECIEFRNKFWSSQFFEVGIRGQISTKAEMIAMQRAAHPAPGVGPHPDNFHLMAVYGNFALATDHTNLMHMGPDGKLVGQDCTVLRMFVKEGGEWRPAGAALVPIVK
ncbi:MAG: nuclear transport factor 2 family protein [Candidatus Acidiferrales bacterium]